MNKQLRRVVITGLGMVSPLGVSVQNSWQSLIQGRSGIKNIKDLPKCQNSSFPEAYIAPIHEDFDQSQWKIPFTPSLTNSFLLAATEEALKSANFHPKTEENLLRTGVFVGSMNSNLVKMTENISSACVKGFSTINRLMMLNVLTNMGTANISVKYGLKGPCGTSSTACATGATAIGEAFRLIQLDEADVMIAGGSDEVVNPVCIYSSMKMQAMSVKKYENPQESSRPFDQERSGFILGEGAGVLILEELSHAKQRNAQILAEILAYGCASDGYHLTKPLENGDGGLRAMNRCLAQSGVSFKEIDHINCHATSTPVGDEAEAKAISEFLRNDEEIIKNVSVTANKGAIGHCFAAAGAIETIFAVKSIENQWVPGILNLKNPIIKPQLNFVRKNTGEQQKVNKVIKNSFGFGGVNVSLLLAKFNNS